MCGVEFISNVCDVSIYPHLFGRDKVKQGERSCMLFALLDCEYGIVLFQRVWINIMCNLVGIALLVRMYTKVWKENIFVTVSIYVVGMMCDAFVTFLFIPYKDGNMYNQVYGAIGILLMFVCELIAGRIVSGQKNRTRTYHLSLICISLCSILLVTILIYTKSSTYRGITIICLDCS